MNTPYWMIEKQIDGCAHWWRSSSNGGSGYWNDDNRWVTDSTKATHFASRVGAEWVMGTEMLALGCVATDHIDLDDSYRNLEQNLECTVCGDIEIKVLLSYIGAATPPCPQCNGPRVVTHKEKKP